MKSLAVQKKLLVLCSVLFVLLGCKQPETVVVEENPTTIATDTTSEQSASESDAKFRELLIGEYQKINSLDPLFADNTASMRAVQLVYEGLVRLNQNGSVVEGLAKNWEISNDSLSYRFTLRSDIYYQDSEVFSTGTGRRLVAQDVKYVFERMAKSNVPPNAAQLFMDIRGFEPYFQEQRLVYYPTKRSITDISGLTVQDKQTIVFELEQPDPNFLKKLATPFAVIYPREAVGQTATDYTPVGAGPFNFSQRSASDSTLTFSKFNDYYNAAAINLNRVDITTSKSESDLFQLMSTSDLYLLPQLGPQLMKNVLNTDSALLNSYQDRYNLKRGGGTTEYVLRHNPHSKLTNSGAQTITQILATDSLSYTNQFPGNNVTSQTVDTSNAPIDSAPLKEQLYAVYSDDPFVRTFLGSLSNSLSSYGSSLSMIQIQAPSRNTELLFTKNYPLIPNNLWDDYQPLYHFSVIQTALTRNEIKGLELNKYPWWFDLRGVTLPPAENMN